MLVSSKESEGMNEWKLILKCISKGFTLTLKSMPTSVEMVRHRKVGVYLGRMCVRERNH